MNVQELEIGEDVVVVTSGLANFSGVEQETTINMFREPWNGDSIIVDTTDQGMLLKLLRSDYFVLTKVLVSEHPRNKGYVLGITGTLNGGVTIKQKKRQFTEEHREKARLSLEKAREARGE